MSYDELNYDGVKNIRSRLKANFQDRQLWFARNLPAYKLTRLGSLIYVDSSPTLETANVVSGAPDSYDDVARVSDHYFLHHSPAQWWLPTDISSPAAWWLSDCGWVVESVSIGLAALPELSKKACPDFSARNLEIKVCRDPAEVVEAGLIQGAELMKRNPRDGGLLFKMYREAAEAIAAGLGGLRLWLAYADGVPVCSAVTLEKDGGLGLYDLTTHPAHRGQGYGRACLARILKDSGGSDLLVLQSTSGAGVSFYSSLGFVPVMQFVLWSNATTL